MISELMLQKMHQPLPLKIYNNTMQSSFYTTGDVLNRNQQDAFERYIRNGGGFVGIHAASDTEYNWPWWGISGCLFRQSSCYTNRYHRSCRQNSSLHYTYQNTGSEQMNGITTMKILGAGYMS